MKWVAVMRRYLVVANQTLHRAELHDELRKRISEGPCSFFVLVPNTRAAHCASDCRWPFGSRGS